MKQLFALALIPLLLTSGHAGPAPTSINSGARPATTPIGGQAVLYDQNSDDNGIGTVSQDFEADYDAYVSQGADDFTVPNDTCWDITNVDVTGVYFSGAGPASSVNVTFYRNNSGVPKEDKIVGAYTGIVPVDNQGSFSIVLPSAVKIKPGKYWVSVQANMDFSAGGQWAWETRQTQVGSAAAWKNPAGGFGTGCNEYGRMLSCFALGQGPDYMFSLGGRERAC